MASLLRSLQNSRTGKKIAFLENGEVLRCDALAGRAATIRGRLRHAGVRPGHHAVGILVPSSPAFAAALLGTLSFGAAAVPLPDPELFRHPEQRADLIARVVDTAHIRALLVDDPHTAAVQALRARRPRLQLVTCADLEESPDTADLAEPDPDSPAVIQFNSGPMLTPRGVVLSHRAVMAGASSAFSAVGAGPDDRVIVWVPLSYDMGLIMLLGSLLASADLHVARMSTLLHRPARVLDYLQTTRITICSGPNVCYERLRAAITPATRPHPHGLQSLRAAVLAGEMVNPHTVAGFTRDFAPYGLPRTALTPAYGLAENTLMATCTPPGSGAIQISVDRAELEHGVPRAVESAGPHSRTLVSAGRPAPGVTLRIVGPDGASVSHGHVGEIQLRSPSLMTGYLGNDHATTRVFDGPWLRTGDQGFLHDGDLYVCGRKKEMVIVHGRNFYATDVEQIARTIPQLATANLVAFAECRDGVEQVVVAAETTQAASDHVNTEVQRRCATLLGFQAVRTVTLAPGTLPTEADRSTMLTAAREVATSAAALGTPSVDHVLTKQP